MDTKDFLQEIIDSKHTEWDKRMKELFEDVCPFNEKASEEGFIYHCFMNNKYIGTYNKMPTFGDTVVISDMEGYVYKDGKKIGLKIDLSPERFLRSNEARQTEEG